jgi:hypothetical protein
VKTAADYASYTPSAYSATDMANGTYCDALNAYVNADSEDSANVLWYQSGAQGAPVPVTNLKVSKATVSVGQSPAIVALISGVGHLPAEAEVELVDSKGNALVARKADDTRYRFDIAVDLADIGLDETYTVMVNGVKSVHADTISVAGLLGEIYASSTAAEQGLMVAMLNYSYYAGNTTAFDVFNAVAGTALAPSIDGVSEIAGAGALSITEGYEVALDVTNGFVVIVTKGGETLGTYSKSVLNATDVINLGDAGEVTVAAMLNVYLANAETHDLAAAAILYYNAAVAAQDAATMS